MSCTGKGTICNMGAEIGATTSTFGYDDSMSRYLKATGPRRSSSFSRRSIKELLDMQMQKYMQTPEKYFDQVIEINLK